MKRMITLVLAALLVAALFAGCELLGSPAGTYTLNTINGKSVKEYYTAAAEAKGIDAASLLALLGLDVDHPEDLMQVTLKDDGTVEYRSNFDFELREGEGVWKQDNGKTVITLDDESIKIDYAYGKLTAELVSSGKTLNLVLKK